MRYTLKSVAEICAGRFEGNNNVVDSVVVDSRRSFGVDECPLFVAIQGRNFDGHDFIGELYRRGVRGFLVEKEVDYTLFPEAGFVVATNSLRALQALAADYRSSFKGVMVAITGSRGKTVVKEWIAQLAPKGVKIFRSPRSYNSQLGVPLSILMMAGDEDIAVIEAGISRPGEMTPLANIIRPNVGIFTMLGDEHGENFASAKQKAEEKSLLFASCDKVIYNSLYSEVEEVLRERYPSVKYYDSRSYMDWIADTPEHQNSLEYLDSTDAHYDLNKAIVASFYEAVGFSVESILPRLKDLQTISVGFDIREGLGGSLVVSDLNNTDINSLAISVGYLKNVAAERRCMLILSDILYSSLSDREVYGKVAEIIEGNGIEYLVGIGDKITSFGDLFHCDKEFYHSAEEFLAKMNSDKISGMAILVKGNMSLGFSKITHYLERKSHTTVLEISLDAMINNLNYFRSKLPPKSKVMAMVKASGYGNGNYELANMLQNQGVDYLAVAFADEGARLREMGITMPIVVLNADSDSFELMVANRLEPEIYSFKSLNEFIDTVRDGAESPYPIHIKLDTGMHRLGFDRKDVANLVSILKNESSYVVARSVFSHLAAADVPFEDEFTIEQIALFDRLSSELISGLKYKPLRHIVNSAGIERFPQACYDMCRLGIGLYGVSSISHEVLSPVSRLVTRIVQIKELGADDTVGYGRAGKLNGVTRVATIPVGYADGLDRRLGEGRWSMLVGGKRTPIIGRVCMDSCMIDVTGVDCSEGDEVVVFGSVAGSRVEDMATTLGTIPYEIMTSISERVKRIYLKD